MNYIVTPRLLNACNLVIVGSDELISMAESKAIQDNNLEVNSLSLKSSEAFGNIHIHCLSYSACNDLLDLVTLCSDEDTKVTIHSTLKGFEKLGIDLKDKEV